MPHPVNIPSTGGGRLLSRLPYSSKRLHTRPTLRILPNPGCHGRGLLFIEFSGEVVRQPVFVQVAFHVVAL